MWNDVDDINEQGEAVKLFLPVNGPPRRTNTNVPDSHIGGLPFDKEIPKCRKCDDPMYLLSQLRTSHRLEADNNEEKGGTIHRTVYVFACPKGSCCDAMEYQNGFSAGMEGVMACQVKETHEAAAAALTRATLPVAPQKSHWYADESPNENNNDWGLGSSPMDGANDDNDDDVDDEMAKLEQAMNAMEAKLENGALPKQQKTSKSKTKNVDHSGNDDAATNAFRCYMLSQQLEPLAPHKPLEEDDVGLSASDDKIRNMLARYMAEEEDENILAALKGTDMGSGMGEEDERLSEEERYLLSFQDRVRRSPRQVIRYAHGGEPLWSIPSKKNDKPIWQVPKCSTCGTKCTFEMQLLPSLLHVLEVDQFSAINDSEKVGIGELLSSGMNWGSVAIFTCPNKSCTTTNGSLVIQESVDEKPDARDGDGIDFTPTMAIVEDMDDDEEFEPYNM